MNNLDQYYTKPDYAEHCVSVCKDLFGSEFNYLEPSAGMGAFSDLFSHSEILAFDLEPKAKNVTKRNFFDLNLEDTYFTIGNPPFGGKRAHIAVDFFNHAAKFSSHIAFIVPRSFRKNTIQNSLSLDFHLVYDEDCPANSFILNGEEHNVNTCFQVWVRKDHKREKQHFQKKHFEVVKPGEDFDYVMRFYGARSGDFLANDFDGITTNVRFLKVKMKGFKEIVETFDFNKMKMDVASIPCISPWQLECAIDKHLEDRQ